jgi:hypothetical protein
LPTSRKTKPSEEPSPGDAPPVLFADMADLDADGFLDQAIPMLRTIIMRQMRENKATPRSPDTAARRARDSSTLSSLTKTLDQLNALDKSREKKGKKSKAKDDAELKERFVRRLDQLLAGGGAGGVPAKPERG